MSVPRDVCETVERRWLEAVEWHALRCSATVLTREQQAEWRYWWQDGENRRVYGSCARLHADVQRLPMQTSVAEGVSAARSPEASAAALRRAVRGAVMVSAALACALIGGALQRGAVPVHTETVSAPPAHYQTGFGQIRRIRLQDGSTIVLGAETSLTAILTPQRRAIHLVQGEAWFRVTHRPDWPFVVNAGRGTITDLGTAFVVDREPRRVEVTVTEGRVQIALNRLIRTPRLSGVKLEPVRLRRGQRFSYGVDAIGSVRAVDPHMALSWTSGELEFSDEPLSDVAANLSRYAPQPIAVSPAAGRLRLSTLVFSRHIAEWLNGLSQVLPVTVERTDVGVCVRLRTRDETQPNNACRKR